MGDVVKLTDHKKKYVEVDIDVEAMEFIIETLDELLETGGVNMVALAGAFVAFGELMKQIEPYLDEAANDNSNLH